MKKLECVKLGMTYVKAYVPATKQEYIIDKRPSEAKILKDTGRGPQWGAVIDGDYVIFSEVKIIATSTHKKK
jgi:hypothetical protein